MNRALSETEAGKLAKIAGMLGSDHDGERAAAALKLDAALKAHGLTAEGVFSRLVAAPLSSAAPEPVRAGAAMNSWRWQRPAHQAKADAVLASPLEVTDWERQFLATVRTLPTISAKQSGILARLYDNAVEADNGR